MSLENARNYVSEVKSALGGSTPRYKEFLSILKGYRTGEKPVTVVIEQVSQLFQGNRELTLGFNTFLPDDYKIELTSDDDEVEEDTTAEVEDKAIESSGSGKRKKSANKKSSSDVAISLPKRRLIHQIPKNRVTSATRILLSPLTSKMQPSDLFYGHDPLAMSWCYCVIKRVAMRNTIWDAYPPRLYQKQNLVLGLYPKEKFTAKNVPRMVPQPYWKNILTELTTRDLITDAVGRMW
ncbi:hypothetical protein ACHAWC_010651 [Mediolabrus comicus]